MNTEDRKLAFELRTLDVKYFKIIRDMLYDKFGINLNDSKLTLVEARLNKLLRKKAFKNYPDYIDYLKTDCSGEAMVELTSILTTNHTHFNRESAHFDHFKKVSLPEHIQVQEKLKDLDLRIWCAACSSGEESYMLAMLIRETLGDKFTGWDASLLATDLSNKVMGIAQAGVYTEERLKDLPESLRKKYFKKSGPSEYMAADLIKKKYRLQNFQSHASAPS